MKTEVVVSKYTEFSSGRDVLRIQFAGTALTEMCRIFGDRWSFTPRIACSSQHGLTIQLVKDGKTHTYLSKDTVNLLVDNRKTILIYDRHLKGETLANVVKIPPFPTTANGTTDSFVISVPAIIAFGTNGNHPWGATDQQGELFQSPSKVVVKDASQDIISREMIASPRVQIKPKSLCDLTLRFADGTKMVRAISMVEAAEIMSTYIKKDKR